jgi:hypothetical protein
MSEPNEWMVVAVERKSQIVDYCIGPFVTYTQAEIVMIREYDVAAEAGQYGRYRYQVAPVKGE